MELKYFVLLAALVVVALADKKAKLQDPEAAKLAALQRQKLQYHKQKVLAPYNEGRGVTCAHKDGQRNKANTCIFTGSYCGFFCECPKCQCIQKDHVGVEIDGFRECLPGNLDPPLNSFKDVEATTNVTWPPADAKQCRVTAQCKSNLICTEVESDYTKYCMCPRHMVWNSTLTLCEPPSQKDDDCDPTVGCGFGAIDPDTSGTIEYIGHYCSQDTGTQYKCQRCNVLHCAECSQQHQCSRCDIGRRLQKGTGHPPLNADWTINSAGTPTAAQKASDACVACAAAFCKRCDSQTVITETSDANNYMSTASSAVCDECMDGYFKDSTNKYTCTKKVQYQRPCKGELEECETVGAECRSVNGNKMCTCKPGYTWNPSGCFCVHPDANLNVEVNRTCKYDRKNFRMADDYFENDASLQVCKAGLECVDSCSPCAGCPGKTVCVTPIPYPEPPCAPSALSSSGGSSNNAGSGSAAPQPGNNAGAGAGSASEGGKESSAGRAGTSLIALFASLALASLFW